MKGTREYTRGLLELVDRALSERVAPGAPAGA
jgi:hypothetical protein